MQITAKKPGIVRLGSFNVHMMVDGVDNPRSARSRKREPEQKKSEESMAAVAEILRDSEVDIVSLQEVETLEMLEELRDKYGLKNQFPYIELIDGNDKVKGIDVAIMSKYPIKRFVTHKDHVIGEISERPRKFARDLLEVDVTLPNKQTLRIFSNHFTMPRNNYYCNTMRHLEAEAAAQIIKEQTKKYPVTYSVIMGDFNGVEGSKALKAFDNIGYHNLSKGLPCTWGEIRPRDKRFDPARLDHIISDEALAKKVEGRGVFVHPREAIASDHRLIYVDVSISSKASNGVKVANVGRSVC